MSLDAQLKSLERKLTLIAEKDTKRAYTSAANKTAALSKTALARKIAQEAQISARGAKSRLYIRRATANKQETQIAIYAKPVNAIRAGFTKMKRGFKVGGKVHNRAFLAKGNNNKRHYIYQRKGRERLPIEMVNVEISHLVSRYSVAIISNKVDKDFQRLLKQEFEARINGYVQRRY